MEIKHIYWFSYFNLKEPSVRYRAKYPLEYFKKEYGITYSIVYPGYDFKNFSHFLLTFFSVLFFRKNNSIIVFQKIFTNGIYTNALKFLLFCRPNNTLYDIDDAEYTRRPAGAMHHFMKKCSICAAGSQSIMYYITPFNKNVFFSTSPVIDHGFFKTKLHESLTIGWIGYYGAHRPSLTQLFFPALIKIDFPVKLIVMGVVNETEEIKSYFSHNPNITIEAPLNIDWLDENLVYETISTFDIGVSPLNDTDFNRGKSAFKLKQCLSCGVPVLGSSIGENRRYLQDGINGYFCDSPEEYIEKIFLLKNEIELGQTLSQNASATFPAFSIQSYCEAFLKNISILNDSYLRNKDNYAN
ncbi:MAG: glycosyltransferase [Bacteroidia bacterium]